jgi:hypothetical protein
MKRLYILTAAIIAHFCSFAQPFTLNAVPQGSVFYNNTPQYLWSAGLAGSPILPNHFEGHAQLNDTTASPSTTPLFSTNGINVYNGAGTNITGGPLLLGHTFSTNSAQVVRLSSTRAMIFTTQTWSGGSNLAHYTLVDLTTPTAPIVMVGAGNRNVPISGGGINRFSEKSVIIPRFGTTNYWLVLHEYLPGASFTNKYVVFEINSGTNTVNYVATYALGSQIRNVGHKGQMKAYFNPASNTGRTIAAAHLENANPAIGGNIDILNFDGVTGVMALRETIKLDANVGIRPYGLEFGDGGRLLYFNSFNIARQISRVDVTAAPGTIWSTRVTGNAIAWSPVRRFMQMQRMRSGSIFFPSFFSNRLNELVNSANPTSFFAFVSGGPALGAASNYWRGISNYPCMQ